MGELMTTLACTLLVGNPKPNSRTLAVASRVTELLSGALGRFGVVVEPVKLVDLSRCAAGLLEPDTQAGQLGPVLDAIASADLLVVASPTFKATYAGLLKVFLDLLEPRAFGGTIAVAVMTAASRSHRHAVETYLRPLLLELGARMPVPGLCVLESEFADVDRTAAAWCDESGPILAAVAERFDLERAIGQDTGIEISSSCEGGARWSQISRHGLSTWQNGTGGKATGGGSG